MKKKILCLIILFASIMHARAQFLPGGTYPVGLGNPYSTLTDVANALKTNTLLGDVVFEIQVGYNTNFETFPITFKPFASSGGTWKVTIRPAANTTTITEGDAGANNALISLDSADRICFDGRAGGTGPIAWTVRNKCALISPAATPAITTSAGPVFQFINDATYDTLRYLTVEGMNPVVSSGLIFFGTTTGTLGNSYCGVSYCNIRDRSDTTAGTGTPATCVMSSGTANAMNRFNTVSYCNVFNFFYPSTQTQGIRVDAQSSNWYLLYNRIYQEQPRTFSTANNQRGIRLNNSASGTGFQVIGNVIGYSSANGTGTFSYTGPGLTNFSGMDISLSPNANSVIRANVISNITLNTASTLNSVTGSPGAMFEGLHLDFGDLTVDSNIIGSTTDTSSIRIIVQAAGGAVYGMSSVRPKAVIANNVIGGIRIVNPTPGTSKVSFTGITSAGGSVISNNVIGSATLPLSIVNRSGETSSSTGSHITIGINIQAATSIVNNNIIANIACQGDGVSPQLIGINSTGTTTAQRIGTTQNGTGNRIFRLFNTAPNVGTGASASVIGILHTNTTVGQLITQNTIHSLYNTNASAAVSVVGMHYAGNTSNSGDVVSRNFIHSLAVTSSNTASSIIGLSTGTSSCNYQNNIIRLGIDSAGTSITAGYAITGISNTPSGTGTDNYYHNTVYIGGTNVTAVSNTYAFNRTAVTNTTNVQNNILVNVRSNLSGTGINYVLRNNSTTSSGLNSNANLYYRDPSGGKLFGSSALSFDSIYTWQVFNAPATPDLNSGVGDPKFVNATGPASSLNLALLASNPAESSGMLIAAVTDDYNGNTRSTRTPNDIGAVSGLYTLSPDVFPPAISFVALGADIVTTTRNVTGVKVTDNRNVAAGLSLPRLYYKKKTENNAFGNGNFPGVNGWKYVTANNNSSPFNFTLDYTLLGTAVAVGDTIQYFIVAQDSSDNLGYSPAPANYNFLPPVQNITQGPASPNYFAISSNGISGNKTVCALGCDYNSLTNVGGLFQAMDSLAVTGNITATVSSDLLEDGIYSLLFFGSTYSLTIQPDASARTISNSPALASTIPLIHLNGAANVKIDGGISRNLIFKNTNTNAANTGATIQFSNGAANDTLKNCIIQNNGTAPARGNVLITGTTGANNIVITQNKITDTSSASTQQPGTCILANSATSNNLYITNNEICNFKTYGISVTAFGSNCVISGNSVYNNTTAVPATGFTGINIAAGTDHTVASNYIGGQAPLLGGGTWTFASNTASFGISYSSPGTNVIRDNHIGFFGSTLSAVLAGINATGSANPLVIKQNDIHDITSVGTNGSLFVSLGGITLSSTNQNNQITDNTIYNLYINSASGSPGVTGIGTNGNSSHIAGGEISRNRIYNFLMNPASTITPDIKGIGPLQGNSTVMNITIANNFISLGDNITNNVQLEGIWNNAVAASTVNVYHNTVYIGGTVSGSSTIATAALLKPNATLGVMRNNIFYNTRTRTSGTAVHTALTNSGTTPATAWNSNYNLLYATDTTNAIGTWGTVSYGFTAWKNVTAYDANSKSKTVSFSGTLTGDLHITGFSVGDVDLAGMPLPAVPTDFDQQARSAATPYMGADELPGSPLPVQLLSFTAKGAGKDVVLQWLTAQELGNAGFSIERSVDGINFTSIGFVKARVAKSEAVNSYSFTDAAAMGLSPVLYYRLKQTDLDGQYRYSAQVAVRNNAGGTQQLLAYPNPFNHAIAVAWTEAQAGPLEVTLTDLFGKTIYRHSYTVSQTDHALSLDDLPALPAGVYLLSVQHGNGQRSTLRLSRAE